LEYAAFLPFTDAKINGDEYKQGNFIAFDNKEGMIEFTGSNESTDVILFGGEHYNEPIVAAGPFVMNTEHEISEAYNDFYKGKYGEIEYESRIITNK
jgi:redox-sensitive bicupin YhaK (pirin superfamily)